ncbi:MAG: hypothetical protein AAGM36_19320 [Cyanobacteria bacterium J06597_1]
MDSRTKFYGPVLAMLSLSAVAFSGFVTPPLEIEESTSESEQRQEEAQPANQPTDPSTTNSSEATSTPEGDSAAGNTTPSPLTDESTPDSNPEPVTLLDLLFIPIPDDPPQPSAAE